MKIAALLKIPGEAPTEFWEAKQWSAYRAHVIQALEKEKLPNF